MKEIAGGRLYFGVNEKLERDGSSVLVVKSDVICQVPWKDGRIDGDVFVVNTRTHALLAWFVVADGVVRSIKRVKSVNFLVDISADGDRWEGEVDSQTGAICGWGEVYDRNNVLVYRGFRVNDEKLFIGHIPRAFGEADVYNFLSQYAPIRELTMIKDSKTNEPRGICVGFP